MPTTTRGIPYVGPQDVPDLGVITQQLAEKVDAEITGLRPRQVTAAARTVQGTTLTLVTITTVVVRAGEAVRLDGSVFSSSSEAAAVIGCSLFRGTTEVDAGSFPANSANRASAGILNSLTIVDFPPAGTYTYTLRAVRAVGTANIDVARSRLAITKV